MFVKLIYGLGTLFSGFLGITGLLEFYRVGIKKVTESYPFGGEGPVPYYYKTAELYSNVQLTWGIIFTSAFLLGIWNWKTKKVGRIKIIALFFGLLLLQIGDSIFEYFI